MNIAIVGLGLMGGSLGRALVSKTSHIVYGYDQDQKSMKLGELIKAYHKPLNQDNLKEIDLLIVALYQNLAIKVLPSYLKDLKKGAIVMDIAGNKRTMCDFMKELSNEYQDIEFISSHPMAGREFSGIKHSTNNLFERASMILVPVKADIRTIKAIKELSLQIGFSKVVITTKEEHDRIIAFTSQLAHIISSSYIKSPTAEGFLGFSAGSFRDMTRVARLSPTMWTELMSDNGDNLVKEIDYLIKHLEEYKSAIKDKDQEKLYKLLEDGNTRKIEFEKLKNKEK